MSHSNLGRDVQKPLSSHSHIDVDRDHDARLGRFHRSLPSRHRSIRGRNVVDLGFDLAPFVDRSKRVRLRIRDDAYQCDVLMSVFDPDETDCANRLANTHVYVGILPAVIEERDIHESPVLRR